MDAVLAARMDHVDARIASLKANTPNSPELARYENVIKPDLVGQFGDAGYKAYQDSKIIKTHKELMAEKVAQEAAVKQMESNKDSNSI